MSFPLVSDALGLNSDPFADCFRRELRPQSPADLAQYVRVEGFGRQVGQIQNWFEALGSGASDRGMLRVLIYGPNGSGRTSVGHFILQCYYQSLTVQAPAQVILEVKVENDHPMEPSYIAFRQLYDAMTDPPQTPDNALDDLFYHNILVELNQFIPARTQPVMNFLRRKMGGQLSALTCIFENVRTLDQIEKARDACAKFPLLVFTTTSQDLLNRYRAQGGSPLSVELSDLTWQDIQELVVQRWQICSNGQVVHPFIEADLEKVFQRPYSLRAVINVLAESFAVYLNQLEQNPPAACAVLPQITDQILKDGAYEYYHVKGGR